MSDIVERLRQLAAHLDQFDTGTGILGEAADEIERLWGGVLDAEATTELLQQWQTEACDELKDIKAQWGGDYVWCKHNERFVADLLQRAGQDDT